MYQKHHRYYRSDTIVTKTSICLEWCISTILMVILILIVDLLNKKVINETLPNNIDSFHTILVNGLPLVELQRAITSLRNNESKYCDSHELFLNMLCHYSVQYRVVRDSNALSCDTVKISTIKIIPSQIIFEFPSTIERPMSRR